MSDTPIFDAVVAEFAAVGPEVAEHVCFYVKMKDGPCNPPVCVVCGHLDAGPKRASDKPWAWA